MSELKTTTSLVKHILEEDQQARNSDSFLYFRVLEYHCKKKGLDFQKLTMADALLNRRIWNFPPSETVRRARQAIQAKHPNLAPNAKVAQWRGQLEEEYRDFAREMKA